MKTMNSKDGGGVAHLLASLSACVALAVFPSLASTCIVTPAAGDSDPHSTLASSEIEVDAAGGIRAILDSALEARFMTYGASLGIGLTTKPLGLQFSIQ